MWFIKKQNKTCLPSNNKDLQTQKKKIIINSNKFYTFNWLST